MKKRLLIFVSILSVFFFTCNVLYATPPIGYAYSIYKVTKIGLSYTGASTPEVEIPLSQTFDFQWGIYSQLYVSDRVIYAGEVPNGIITGIWVYVTEVYEYDQNGNLLNNYSSSTWFDCRAGKTGGENITITVSEGERAKIIMDYTSNGFVDTKEAL